MNKHITTLLFILLTYSTLWAQEQLTFIQSFANEGSDPVYVGSVNNKTVFTLNKPDLNGEQKRELWVTDGTEAGTVFISNTVPVKQTGIDKFVHKPTNVIANDGFLYFEVAPTKPSTYSELWRTDGTVIGTSKVLDVVTAIPYSSERLVYLLASKNYFFIVINFNDARFEINKYTPGFQLIDHNSHANICYPASPYVFRDILYGDCMDFVTIKEKVESKGLLYQFYEFNEYAVETFGQAKRLVLIFDGTNSRSVSVVDKNDQIKNWNSPGYRQVFSKYFEYNGQVYALYVGTIEGNSSMTKHLNVELYVLNEDGFKLKSLTTEPSMYSIESIWHEQSMLHIITREKNYSGNTEIVFKHHKIDIEKEYPTARSVKTIFEGDRGLFFSRDNGLTVFKKDHYTDESFIYYQPAEEIIPVAESLDMSNIKVSKTANGNYFVVASSSEKGAEPYWLDISNKSFKLLKDINALYKGVAVNEYTKEFAIGKNPLLWITAEKKGMVLYKSDGTKENTKPLKMLSTDNKPILIRDSYIDNFFSITYEGNKHDNKKLYFSSDGTENGTHILGNFPYGTEIIKSDGNYYCLSNENDGVRVLKFTFDGKSEVVRKITRLGLFGIHNVGIDFILEYINTSFDDRVLMSALTEKVYTDMVPLVMTKGYQYYDFSPDFYEYKAPFQPDSIYNSIHYGGFFKKKGTKDIFIYEKGEFIKFLTFEGDDLTAWKIRSGEIVFYSQSAGKIWITDKTIGHTKEIPTLFKELQLSTIKKVKQDYYFLFTKDGLYNMTGYKIQVYKNMTNSEVSLPSRFFQTKQGIINDVPYFYSFDGQGTGSGPVSLDFYKLENDNLTKINPVRIDYTPFSVSQLDNSFFCNPLFSVIFWHPSGYEVVAEGRNAIVSRLGNKYILSAINRDQWGGSRHDVSSFEQNNDSHPVNGVSLYITDGTKAGTKLLKGFTDLGYEMKQVGNKVYFNAYTPETGYEPWETDGTPQGTKMVGDLLEGPQSSNPASFTDVNGVPVCLASTPDLGRQLFSLLTKLDAPLLATPNTQACEGETIVLIASKGFDSYKWIIDDTQELITTDNKLSVTQSGTYKVIVGKDKASSYPSNEVSIHFIPLPAKPVIKQENNQLIVSATGQLQWYFNGTAITAATTNTLTYTGSGDYAVKVTENTCSVLSDKLMVSITATEEPWEESVYPNPASHKLIVKATRQQPTHLELITVEGKTVLQQTLSDAENEINLKDFNKGVYILKLNQHTRKIIIE